MSSDVSARATKASPPSPPADGRTPERFGRTAAVLILALLVVAVSLAAVTAVRGPRVVQADLDLRALAERPLQRIRLHLDQPIAAGVPVTATITPDAAVRTFVDPTTITLTTQTALRYATTYTVTVPVTVPSRQRTTELRYSFTTPAAAIFLLDRAAQGDDRILEQAVGAEDATVVYHGPRIEEFATTASMIAVSAEQGPESGTLKVGPLGGDLRTVADHAHVEQLHASTTGSFGYVITGLDGAIPTAGAGPDDAPPSALQLYDPTVGRAVDVLGLDGQPLNPRDWAFVPGTTAIVAQDADLSVLLLDPVRRTPPRQLGTHVTVEGFLDGSTTVLLEDADHRTAVDLVTGKATRVDTDGPRRGDNLLRLAAVAGRDRFAGQFLRESEGGYHHFVALLADGRATELYTPTPATQSILQICPSPNGQYLAVETVAADAAADDHTVNPGFDSPTTVVVDTADGRVVSSGAGFASSWCG